MAHWLFNRKNTEHRFPKVTVFVFSFMSKEQLQDEFVNQTLVAASNICSTGSFAYQLNVKGPDTVLRKKATWMSPFLL